MFAASKTSTSALPDAQFNYVTMLLHGDGTNGAQNNTFVDSSTNNFTITRTGNTTQGSFSPYGSNWANYFDGSGDYLSLADNAAFDFGTGDFTIECWLYRLNNSGTGVLEHRATPDAIPYLWYITSSNNYLEFFNGTSYTGNVSVPQNQWVHIAVSRQSGTLRQFINGQVASSNYTVSGNLDTTGSVIIMGSIESKTYNGYCSNFRVVKGTAVYTSAFTPSTTPLTAITNTSFLTCQSNRFIDNSTNNLAITVNGNTSVQRFNPFGTSTAYSTSVIGGSAYFDGSGDYLNLASNAAFGFNADFTVELFVYPTSTVNSITMYHGSVFDSLILYTSGSGNVILRAYASADILTSSGTLVLNAWNHVAVSRSGSTISLWLNGSRANGATGTNSTTWSTTAVYIGSSNTGTSLLTGWISDVRTVKGTAVYNPSSTTITVPTAPLTAVTNTVLLCNMTNGAIFDNSMMNNFETVGNAQISTSVVKYGTGSLKFDGTGDNLIAPSSPNLSFGTGDFTIEGWIYLNSVSGFQTLVSIRISGSDATTGHYSLAFRNAALEFYASGGVVTSGGTASTSTWTHFACTRSNGSVRLFLNGTQVGSTASFTTSIPEKIVAIASNNGGSEYLNGYIDDLRITKGYARYTSNFTAPTAAFSDKGPY